MRENSFKKDLKLVRKFGREYINGKSFENYLSGNEEYFKIIDHMLAIMIPWKKNYHPNQIRERIIFNYRRIKGHLRRKENIIELKKGGVFFLPISETNVIFFEPIIKKVLEKNNASILRFDYSLDGLKKEIKKRSLPYVNFEKYLDKKTIKTVKKNVRRYHNAFKFSKIILKKNNKYSKMGPSLKYYFGARNRLYEIIELIEGLSNFINKEKPSMIIIGDESMDINRATSYVCKKMGIPCISIQCGNFDKNMPESGETLALKKIVFGSLAKKMTMKNGMPSKKIVVAGSPLYDNIFNMKISETELIREKGRSSNKIVILFASTANLEISKKRLVILFKLANKIPNLKIIIKQHPGEYLNKKYEKSYYALARKYGVNTVVSKDDMWKMLSLSDIYIVDYSTTILEALILNKAIILTNFENFFDYSAYPKRNGVIWHAYNSEDVNNAIMYVLKNKRLSNGDIAFRKKLIKKSLYKTDGKAAERICKIIEKLKLKN